MKIDTMPKKKILAGATAVVALSGFVPAIDAASPTATANVGVSVVIQQAITINVGAAVDFGTIILSAVTVAGSFGLNATGGIYTATALAGEMSHAGGHAVGTMVINSSAGVVNIALGVAPTDNGGNVSYPFLYFGGAAIAASQTVFANGNANVTLIGGVFNIGGEVHINSKPTPGTYNTKSFLVTVTDI